MDPRLQRLFNLFSKALELEQALNSSVVLFRQRIEKEVEIASVRKLAAAFATSYDQQRSEFRALLDEIFGLIKELMETGGEPVPTETKPVRPDAVADQFRKLMDTIQQDARLPRAGEAATTLKNLEIELKGLVVIEEDEARIVPPQPGSQVDPGLLSTIRLSFGTIPVLRPQPEPPPPASPAPTSPAPSLKPPTPESITRVARRKEKRPK
jgi:hypothetical protein